MRGMSPAGTATRGRPRLSASAPSAPPAVIATTGTPRASATSVADSTSAVSPEYETARTSVSWRAAAGRP